ncbi:MAG TPA: sulfurtransferase TusA family protein, partial [Jatrophihabitans sp.]|jgi:cysteine desulfurase
MGALSSGNVRVSLHPEVTDAAVERFLTVLPAVIDEVRGQIPGGRPEALRPGVELAAATTEGPTVQGTVIDSRGRRCPLPVLDLARAIGGVPVGTQITVLADDPAAASDIAAWCRMRQHELVSSSEHEDGARAYRVRRLR